MNLSQDEISALLGGDNADTTDTTNTEAETANTEADAANAEAATAATGEESAAAADADGATTEGAAAAGETSAGADAGAAGGEVAAEEAAAGAAAGSQPAGSDNGDGDGDSVEIMSPEAIAAMLEGGNADFVDSGDGELNELFDRFDADADKDGFLPVKSREGMLTPDEIDILGEVGNISMGAVATTMYELLDRRTSITTPRVSVYEASDVLSVYRIPFIIVTVEYVKGISGNNLLVLKVPDAALITDILMGGDGKLEDPIVLTEMHLSAMSEIMNQMMGASSTSLSKLLHEMIDISPPKATQVDFDFDVSEFIGNEELVTKISFDLEIEGLLKSELIQLIPYELSREFAKRFMEVGMGVPSSDADKGADIPAAGVQAAPQTQAAAPASAEAPPPAMTEQQLPPPDAYGQPQYPQGAQQYPAAPYPAAAPYPPQAPYYPPTGNAAYPPPYPAPPYGAPQGRLVDVHPAQFQSFDSPPPPTGEGKGIDIIYNIPLQVTVELGKTKKEISEILDFNTGTVVVLDKVAGDPVEIVVNGKLIARGEVVVIDESYGVRITDIIRS